MPSITESTLKIVLSILVPSLLAAIYLEHRNSGQDGEIIKLQTEVQNMQHQIVSLDNIVNARCK